MRPKPGVKVIITQSAWDIMDIRCCDATPGSIARAMSFEEYYQEYKSHTYSHQLIENVKYWIEHEVQYPFRFISVAPLPPEEEGIVTCKIGDVVILTEKFFRVLDDEETSSENSQVC